jgi:hypothetical protein
MAKKLVAGKRVLCVEQETGRSIPGFFEYSNNFIETQLTAFDRFLFIPEDQRVTLVTEHLEFVTLFQNIVGSGSKSKLSEPPLSCHTLKIFSSLAVIGDCPWTEGMKVKHVSFELPHSHRIVENEHLKSYLSGSLRFEEMDRHLFRLKVDDVEISVWYAASYSNGDDFPSEWNPRFDVRFDVPRPIDDFTDTLSLISSFVSFCLGAQLNWDQVEVSNMDDAEMTAAIKDQKFFDSHRVVYLQGDFQPNVDRIGNWGSPCLCYDDVEVAAFSKCLAAWIERAPTWKTAYALMMTYLRHEDSIGPERLLNACKCLEQIPGARSSSVVDPGDIQKVIEAAREAAESLGHNNVLARLNSAILSVGNEDHEARFKRLLSGVLKTGLIRRIPSDRMMGDLKNAMGLRGRAAHSALHSNTNEEFQTLARAISAVECLCYLLFASGLPLTEAGKERLHNNPVMSGYRSIS